MDVYNCYNLIRTPKEFVRVVNYLMKYLGKQNFCLDFQIEYFPNGILIHQLACIESPKVFSSR